MDLVERFELPIVKTTQNGISLLVVGFEHPPYYGALVQPEQHEREKAYIPTREVLSESWCKDDEVKVIAGAQRRIT